MKRTVKLETIREAATRTAATNAAVIYRKAAASASAASAAERIPARYARKVLLQDGEKLRAAVARCVNKLNRFSWTITNRDEYRAALDMLDDLTAAAWLELLTAEEAQKEEAPARTIIRAIIRAIRKDRTHGITRNRKDKDGNTLPENEWSDVYDPRHNTEAEALRPLIIDEITEYTKANTRTHYSPEVIREFFRLIIEEQHQPRRAAAVLKISNSARMVLVDAWRAYREAAKAEAEAE